MKSSVLAIIPARANSKRIPGKNKKKFLEKPLICWSIEAAQQAECVQDITVTTDDPEILNMSALYPEVQFVKRPEHLALDSTPGVDPVIDLMNSCKAPYDYVLLLQPTSPLRTSAHIDAAFRQLQNSGAAQLVSVRDPVDNFDHAVLRTENGVGFLKDRGSDFKYLQRMKVLNGAIYFSKWEELLARKTFVGGDVSLYEMSAEDSVDIDHPVDWSLAEFYGKMKER